MSNRVQIEVSGPPHSAKTSVMVLISRMLAEHGIDATMQMADSQAMAKMELTNVELADIVRKHTITITEMQTARSGV